MEYKIYFASLSDYNNGILHGAWIDVEGKDVDEIQDEINEMLDASPTFLEHGEKAEEWAIHDFDFPVQLSEYESLEDIVDMCEAISESDNPEAFVAYIGLTDLDTAKKYFEDAYCGEWDSFQDYVEETFQEIYEIPDHLTYYIDWEKVARDWEIEHSTSGNFVFHDV